MDEISVSGYPYSSGYDREQTADGYPINRSDHAETVMHPSSSHEEYNPIYMVYYEEVSQYELLEEQRPAPGAARRARWKLLFTQQIVQCLGSALDRLPDQLDNEEGMIDEALMLYRLVSRLTLSRDEKAAFKRTRGSDVVAAMLERRRQVVCVHTEDAAQPEPRGEDSIEVVPRDSNFQWLVSRIRRAIQYQGLEPRLYPIAKSLILFPDTQGSSGCFLIDCFFQDFLANQYDRSDRCLRDVICLTGKDDLVYATTCGQYVREMWPRLGEKILQAIEEIASPVNNGMGRSSLPLFSAST